jgi:hypothetical protein
MAVAVIRDKNLKVPWIIETTRRGECFLQRQQDLLTIASLLHS